MAGGRSPLQCCQPRSVAECSNSFDLSELPSVAWSVGNEQGKGKWIEKRRDEVAWIEEHRAPSSGHHQVIMIRGTMLILERGSDGR